MAVFLSGEAGGERETTEAVSPQKPAGWGVMCRLEEAAAWLLPDLSTERCDYHQTHQRNHIIQGREEDYFQGPLHNIMQCRPDERVCSLPMKIWPWKSLNFSVASVSISSPFPRLKAL